MDNFILATDSYKLNHWNQYPKDTEAVYSYFEARPGARFPYTIFFGLQYILLKYMSHKVVDAQSIRQAKELAEAHFGRSGMFNEAGWSHILNEHKGRLPLHIKAVHEGTAVPNGNVLMTVQNTCPRCFWLTNAVESLLTHVWYPSTVATLSSYTLHSVIEPWLKETALSLDALPFMLHDFGYRGASSHESAAIGGCAHLINSVGTDTVPGMLCATEYYFAEKENLAFSVPATEHSVMTALGREGEGKVLDQLLDEYPTGILSVVADSYNIYDFVRSLGTTYKERILARDGKFVVRPDSTTPTHPTPEALTSWIAGQLWHDFGGKANAKGYRVLDPKIGILWGDGIDPSGIDRILKELAFNSFSAENMVFGMGGGLLQRINRDTQRFAFKASAIKRGGEWHDVYKEPLESDKRSKRGRLMLLRAGIEGDTWATEPLQEDCPSDLLQTVFLDGEVIWAQEFDAVRDVAKLTVPHR